MSHTPALEIKDLHVSIEDKEILKGLSLDVQAGDHTRLLGHDRRPRVDSRLDGVERRDVAGADVLGERVLDQLERYGLEHDSAIRTEAALDAPRLARTPAP